MGTATRVAKNTAFLYVRIAVNLLISLYSTRLILGALGAKDFGIYNLVGGAIAMLTFLNSAMAEATQRFMSYTTGEEDSEKQRSIFNVSFILHLIIACFVVILLEIAGYFLFNGILDIPVDRVDSAILVYQYMVVSTFFTILTVPYDAVLNAHENMFLVAVMGIIQSFLKLGVAFYVTYTKSDQLIAYGLLMAILTILLMVASRIYCHIKYEEVIFNFKKYFDLRIFKEMGSFASWSLLSHSGYIITMQGTSVVLNSFFGVIVNAAQGISNQISGQLVSFTGTLLKALSPVIVKSEGKNDRAKMLQASMFGNKISFLLIAFLSIPVLIEIPYILKLWLKNVPEFTEVFCRLNLIRISINSLTTTFYISIGAIGNIKKYSIWESLIFMSALPASYLMFKLGASPEMIYINLIIMACGIGIVRVYFINRLGGLSVKLFLNSVIVRCLGVFIVTLLISTVPLLFLDEGFFRLVIVIFMSSLTFLITVFSFGLDRTERKQIEMLIMYVFRRRNTK